MAYTMGEFDIWRDGEIFLHTTTQDEQNIEPSCNAFITFLVAETVSPSDPSESAVKQVSASHRVLEVCINRSGGITPAADA